MKVAPTKELRRIALLSLLAVFAESSLLHAAQRYDVSMALLSGGGALSTALLALATVTMLARLFVRLVLPGLVVMELLRVVRESVARS